MLEEAALTALLHSQTGFLCSQHASNSPSMLSTIPQQPEHPAAGLDSPKAPAGFTPAACLIPEQNPTLAGPVLGSPLPPPPLFLTLPTRKFLLHQYPNTFIPSPLSVCFPEKAQNDILSKAQFLTPRAAVCKTGQCRTSVSCVQQKSWYTFF